MNTAVARIQWQAEEVAWGAFVPYTIAKAAAERSIQRFGGRERDTSIDEAFTFAECDDGLDWKNWDFVPDGLLVWDAWLQSNK